ncbi:hypothetical protein RHMOL_Rhmol12G0074400 [Rhododendron molle]|uniref:Uncharacterized protein n=1 Tax=Rhododendron molle TaxID=49168 RepID=A0ACC0LFA8_RHOML|nr:hypothetical protein RHMOL_Rhmol12G0074400 [Rhododendron molle]
MTDNITNGITRLFGWYVKNNANLNVRSQEVGGSSDKVDLDGVDMEIDSHKSLKSQFKMHIHVDFQCGTECYSLSIFIVSCPREGLCASGMNLSNQWFNYIIDREL